MKKYIWKQDAIDHAKKCEPEESCGIIGVKNNFENIILVKIYQKNLKLNLL